MANIFYPKGLEGFATKQVDWVNDDIRAILVDLADYAYSAAHDFLNDVPAAARVAIANITGRTATDGILDGVDTPFGVVSGDSSEAIIIYQHTGNEATARLLLYIDTAGGLPLNPGADTTIQWDNGANKIGAL